MGENFNFSSSVYLFFFSSVPIFYLFGPCCSVVGEYNVFLWPSVGVGILVGCVQIFYFVVGVTFFFPFVLCYICNALSFCWVKAVPRGVMLTGK